MNDVSTRCLDAFITTRRCSPTYMFEVFASCNGHQIVLVVELIGICRGSNTVNVKTLLRQASHMLAISTNTRAFD